MKFIEEWKNGMKKEILKQPTAYFLGVIIVVVLFLIAFIGALQTSLSPPQPETTPLIVGSEYPEGTTPLYSLESFFQEILKIKMTFVLWIVVFVVLIMLIK